MIASFIETCKMNGVDPQAYLRDVLARIVARHPMGRIDGFYRLPTCRRQARLGLSNRRSGIGSPFRQDDFAGSRSARRRARHG